MKTIESAYINALLADAAYRPVTASMSQGELLGELETRMTTTQATFIAQNFEVLSSIETPTLLGMGFDAVAWRGKAGSDYAGKVFVSMRGTQGVQDIADDVALATRGIPHQQIADMVNWWLKNTASISNTNVQQIKVVETIVSLVPPLSTYSFALDKTTNGTGALSDVGVIEAVNGHSLGGYLATAFTRLFGANVQSGNAANETHFRSAA